ncbi:MAG: GNAT family N-acetyltransferase [Mycobacteriaceae bacterium]
MSATTVLIPAPTMSLAAQSLARSRYSLLLSTDPVDIEAVQRLRYHVFSSEPGFSVGTTPEAFVGLDSDRFDEYCDHLLVRDDTTGETVGCYRMLPPPAAIAAGGLYTATEFDISCFDVIRPQVVEMGRAVVRSDHRGGTVLGIMWAGILAYLEKSGYEFVTGCVSAPIQENPAEIPGSQVRGVRDIVLAKHATPVNQRVTPLNPVVLDGVSLDSIAAPAKVKFPPLMRGYLRLGAKVCGEPAHDPDFGVADFVAILEKKKANARYLERLRSAAAYAETVR